MPRLLITCPTTGQEVFTGVEIASESIAQMPDIVVRMLCPACRREHAWSKNDVRMEESGTDGSSEGGAG